MKKVLDWFKNLSLKWRFALLFFIFPIIFLIEESSVFNYLWIKVLASSAWVIFYSIAIATNTSSFSILPALNIFDIMVLWFLLSLLYCFTSGCFFQFVFKKFNINFTFKSVFLTLVIFIFFNYVLLITFDFWDLHFNGGGYLIFD